jgi:O-antigen polymerase
MIQSLLILYFYPCILAFFGCVYLIRQIYSSNTSFTYRITRIDIVLAMLLILITINILTIAGPELIRENLLSLLPMVVIYLLFRLILSFDEKYIIINNLFRLLILVGFMESFLGFLQMTGLAKNSDHFFLIGGSFGNPAAYTSFLLTIFPLAFFYSTNEFKITLFRVFSSLTSILIMISLTVTLARASWIPALASMIFILYMNYPALGEKYKYKLRLISSKRHYIIFFTLTVMTLMAAVLLLKKDSTGGRYFVLLNCIAMIREHPLYGIGYDSFKIQYNNYQEYYFLKNPTHEYFTKVASDIRVAYNEYLELWCELGLLAFACFCYLIAVLYKVWIRSNRPPYLILSYISISCILVLAGISYPFRINALLCNAMIYLSVISSLSDAGVKWVIRTSSLLNNALSISMIAITLIIFIQTMNYVSAISQWQSALRTSLADKNLNSVKKYKKVYSSLSHDGAFLMDYGKVLFKAKLYSEAVIILERASKYHNHYKVYMTLGDCYSVLGEYSKAEKSYLKSIHMVPNRFIPRFKIMIFYLNRGSINLLGEDD